MKRNPLIEFTADAIYDLFRANPTFERRFRPIPERQRRRMCLRWAVEILRRQVKAMPRLIEMVLSRSIEDRDQRWFDERSDEMARRGKLRDTWTLMMMKRAWLNNWTAEQIAEDFDLTLDDVEHAIGLKFRACTKPLNEKKRPSQSWRWRKDADYAYRAAKDARARGKSSTPNGTAD